MSHFLSFYLTDMTQPYLPDVRKQYEELPYPPCDPKDEHKRLARTWLEDLPKINHYCFAGRNTFRNGFRALCAGAGTGDASIYLAWQLRNTDAEIVHLDLSTASIAIAQERAQIRGLTNIRFVHASLLQLAELGLGQFDYINCVGVLHHLADPDAGLAALRSVLKDDGALGLAVYGTYGRTAVYQMQELMRRVNAGDELIQDKLKNAKDILGVLPPTNWFSRAPDLHNDHKLYGDSGIYDLLLHSQDRAYTVPELFEWIEDKNEMHIQLTDVYTGLSSYLPHMRMQGKSPEVLKKIRQLPLREQYAICELFTGQIKMHVFYATGSASAKAQYGDPDYVPMYYHDPSMNGPAMEKVFSTNKNKGRVFMLQYQMADVALPVNPGKYGPRILREIDGRKSFREIFDAVRSDIQYRFDGLTDEKLFADFKESYEVLTSLDRLLLRHRDAPLVE